MSFWSDKNVGRIERWASGIGGGVLVATALKRRSLPMLALGAVGGSWLLMRGVTGHCPVYRQLGVDRRIGRRIGRRMGRPAGDEGAVETGIGASLEHAPEYRVVETHQAIDVVQEASEESFPASDAPSWTPTMGVGNPHDR